MHVRRCAYRTLDRATGAPHQFNLTTGPGFVWFRVAKVGTRSFLHAISELDDGEPDWVRRRRYALGLYRRRYKFAFVRNPWDRVASAWKSKLHVQALPDRFDAFVEMVAEQDLTRCDRHWRLQTELIDLRALDELGRFETFQRDASRILTRLGVVAELPHRNATTGRYQDLYTPSLRQKVGELYRADVKALDYTF